MQKLAAHLQEHFTFDFTDTGVTVGIGPEAPPELEKMVAALGASTEALVEIYEALGAIAENGADAACEIDEKICGKDMQQQVYCQLKLLLE